jgi:hypothetical protein
MAEVVELRRGRSRAVEDGDANTWHKRLPLVQAVLQSSFTMTERLQRLGSTAAALG